MTFMDTLSLLKTDGRWQIYNKLVHVEGNAVRLLNDVRRHQRATGETGATPRY